MNTQISDDIQIIADKTPAGPCLVMKYKLDDDNEVTRYLTCDEARLMAEALLSGARIHEQQKQEHALAVWMA